MRKRERRRDKDKKKSTKNGYCKAGKQLFISENARARSDEIIFEMLQYYNYLHV